MATKLVQPPIPASHVVPPTPRTTKMMRTHRAVSATHSWTRSTRFGECSSEFRPIYTIKVAEQSSGVVGGDKEIGEQNEEPSDYRTVAQIKTDLYQAVQEIEMVCACHFLNIFQGINRGIFGVPSAKKSEIEGLVKMLESLNPTPDPTTNLDKLGGCWKLVYSTISILGSKRTKLGLRDFISLGDFLQTIDITEGKAVNVIKFNVRGLNLLNGQLTIEASFKTASRSRVDINYYDSTITPDQLMNMFQKNYDLLLGIFNPEGWLEISYVDDSMRIGRDDKGNTFVLERAEEYKSQHSI